MEWLNNSFSCLAPPPDLNIIEWLEANVNLPEYTCPEPGPLRLSRTPYMKGPLLAFQSRFIETIDLLMGRQLAKSTFIYNCQCYTIGQNPGPTLMLFPDRELAKYTSKNRIQAQFDICEAVCKQKTSDADDYGIYEMKFQNMIFSLGWAGSGSQVMSKPVQNLFFDEVDEMKKVVGKGISNPIESAEQTTSNFPNRKKVKTSTPSTEDNEIWQALCAAQRVFEYWLPCPHCGKKQVLIWDQIKFDSKKEPEEVCLLTWYECIHCKKTFRNHEKIAMLPKGEWRSRQNAPEYIMEDVVTPYESSISLEDTLKDQTVKHIAFHLPKWYSPFEHATFGHAAKEFLEAQGDFVKMRDWTKFWRAKPWREKAKIAKYHDLLGNKIDLEPLTCPHDTLGIITTVDPGQGGFWYTVLAWRINFTPHIVHYGFLSSWDQVTDLVFDHTYLIENTEKRLHCWRMGIDIGGSKYDEDLTMTQACYIWLRSHARNNIFGVKGKALSKSARRVSLSIIDKIPGQKQEIIPGGLAVWLIDTDAFKDAIQYHLQLPKNKPGKITFHADTKIDLIEHLTSEEKERDKKGNWVWVKKKKHNHWWDCLVYNFALADQECNGGVRILRPPFETTKPKPQRENKGWLAGINRL